MMNDSHWVIDPNVLVSALIYEHSVPGRVSFGLLDSGRVLISLELLDEVRRVLCRKKFDKYLTFAERDAFIERLGMQGVYIVPESTPEASRDPNDDYILAIAIDGLAAGIITGDRDLLVLHPFRGIAILTPAQYLAEYGA
jgi:putative PIN family toxin of toxin-antitoxin system